MGDAGEQHGIHAPRIGHEAGAESVKDGAQPGEPGVVRGVMGRLGHGGWAGARVVTHKSRVRGSPMKAWDEAWGWSRPVAVRDGLRRDDSVGREVIAKQMLVQAEE